MNKGLRMARGEYVLFLNAGDTFFSGATLAEVFSGVNNVSGETTVTPEADIYYGQTKIINAEGHMIGDRRLRAPEQLNRSEEHTSELQSLMRISYAVFCLKK